VLAKNNLSNLTIQDHWHGLHVRSLELKSPQSPPALFGTSGVADARNQISHACDWCLALFGSAPFGFIRSQNIITKCIARKKLKTLARRATKCVPRQREEKSTYVATGQKSWYAMRLCCIFFFFIFFIEPHNVEQAADLSAI